MCMQICVACKVSVCRMCACKVCVVQGVCMQVYTEVCACKCIPVREAERSVRGGASDRMKLISGGAARLKIEGNTGYCMHTHL